MKTHIFNRVVLATTLLNVGAPVFAQEKFDNDDVITVTAFRLPEEGAFSYGAVELISAEEIELRQQDRLQDALELSSGVISTSTAGQEGQLGSLIIRGLPTVYNQVLIDGVRISDSVAGGTFGNLFGNFQFNSGESLEISKGSQSVVHGSSAVGGVVGINNSFRQGKPSFILSEEVGSFDYSRTLAASSGSFGAVDYYINAGYTTFDQDIDDSTPEFNEVENAQYSAGVRYNIDDNNRVSFTGRAGQSDLTNSGGFINNEYELFSIKYEAERGAYAQSTVLGYFNEELDAEFGFFPFATELEKWSVTSDHSYDFGVAKLNTGIDFSVNDYDNNGDEIDWETVGLYANIAGELWGANLEFGFRGEYHSDFDFIPAVHASTRYNFEDLGLEVFYRSALGFRAPSLLESEAFVSTFSNQLGNPDLDPEFFVTYELGFEQKVLDKHVFRTTAYAHFLNDAIVSESVSLGTTINQNSSGTSEVFGLETSLKGEIIDNLNYTVAWNYSLKNDIVVLPRNTVSADINYDGGNWALGAGFSHRSNASFDAPGGLFSREIDGFIEFRVYGEWQISENFKLSARIENLFDEEYEINPFAFDFPPPTFAQVERQDFARGRALFIELSTQW